MSIRPIDIARKLGVSTTVIRTYEEMGLLPLVPRSASGYRLYTKEHVAYFICVRGMLPGFSLSTVLEVLKEVRAHKIESAYWIINKAQADLRQEKSISENIVKHLFHGQRLQANRNRDRLTVHEISQETGIPETTIRYWDKVGLLTSRRSTQNNYRQFTSMHVQQALAVYALKLFAVTNHRKYFVDQVMEELKSFDYKDKHKIKQIASGIEQNLAKINYQQIQGIAALHHLCVQVENDTFTDSV